MDKVCTVYWIHIPEHTDLFSQGYIGITTKSVAQRFRQHCNDADNGSDYIVHKAIRKYGADVVVEPILIGTLDYCLEVERKLRPTNYLGWNMAVGGSGKTIPEATEEVKSRLAYFRNLRWSDSEQRKKHSEFMRAAGGNSEALCRYSRDTKPWNRGSATLAWRQADKVYESYFLSKPSAYLLSKRFEISVKSARNLIKHFENGWKPLEDQEWLDWVSTQQFK